MSIVQHHPRRFGNLSHVYPVISRRAGGLSVGINLSPTAVCNFACAYCQVLAEITRPITGSPRIALDQLEDELRFLLGAAYDGSLFSQHWLSPVPPEKRVLRDISFSGDGEPTLSPQFAEAVQIAADLRRECCDKNVKLVLITNASTLHMPQVCHTLGRLLPNNGEIWAKLDAGTPTLFNTVSRSTVPFEHIRSNLVQFTRSFPVVIQTCFTAIHGKPPAADEIRHYADVLNELTNVNYVQIYTAARNTPENWVTPLENEQLDEIAETVRRQTVREIRTYYSK